MFIPDPNFFIPDPGTKRFRIPDQRIFNSKLFLISRKYDPRCSFGIRIRNTDNLLLFSMHSHHYSNLFSQPRRRIWEIVSTLCHPWLQIGFFHFVRRWTLRYIRHLELSENTTKSTEFICFSSWKQLGKKKSEKSVKFSIYWLLFLNLSPRNTERKLSGSFY
jgi:hypothetical protein